VVGDDYAAFACELMSGVGRIAARRMFGGHGLYHDGRMVALVADGRLYLKVDAQTRAAFEAAGSSPFVYAGKGKPVTMSYWLAPDEALDDPSAMTPWARRAIEAAAHAAAGKSPKPRRL
jgi:DNA transformation protein